MIVFCQGGLGKEVGVYISFICTRVGVGGKGRFCACVGV